MHTKCIEIYFTLYLSNQALLEIGDLKVEVVHDVLNLFNREAFISYILTGTIKPNSGVGTSPLIKYIDISERYVSPEERAVLAGPDGDVEAMPHILVVLTPIVTTKKDSNPSTEVRSPKL